MTLSLPYSSFAQSSSTLMGARAAGMGYSSAAIADEWSIFNNVAGLAKVTSVSAAFTYDLQPSFKPYNKAAATFICPVKIGAAGLGLFRFGDDLYNEQILTIGYASSFGLASLGFKASVIQYNIEGFGSKSILTASLGGIAELTKRLYVGAHVININQPKLSDLDDERVPTILVAGIMGKLSEYLTLAMEVEKDLNFKPKIKAGIEYKILKRFFFRTGIQVQPNAGFFGFGFKPERYSVNYSFQYNQGSGSRHQASVSYHLNAKKR